ncbi:MAG: ATP-binding cassette, subfamily bacterial, partial [Actinomycetota bacterium]|nr:ATP-binding cassette, subfamily bacterial [Actinomycetota bacterium]
MKHRSMRLLAPFLRRYWRALAAAATASLVTAAAEVARPFPIAIAIDKVLGSHGDTGFALTTEDVHLIVIAAGLVIVIALCDAAASYQVDVRLERAGERIVHDLRVAIYEHLQRLSLTFHDRRPTGDLVTRLTGDVNAVGGMFSESLGTIATSALLLVGMAAVTIAIDPVLALAAFSVTPVLAAVTVRFRRRLKSVSRRQRATEGEIASLASEALSAMRVVKAMSSEGYEKERMTRRSESVRRDGIEAARIEGRFTGIIDVTGAFATAIVLTLGVYRAASGHISIGELVIVNSYVRRIYRPLRDIARQASRVSRAMARGDRIAEILASDEVLREVASPYHGGRARGDVELSGVTFAYPGGPPVLTDVSLRFQAGQRVAVVGPSGAGKSTLFSLVTRFYDPDAGTVRIDGRDASACSLEWLRDQVGLVLQDTVLFSGTVAENIVYGLSMTTHIDSVVAAATAAGAHEFISALPSGYDTDLGARGVCLSGGQRQRIAIARALLRNPPILLLDEPTAGLDAESEAEVLDGLAVLMQGRTVMMSTHSLALTRSADRVVVLERGRVTQSGSSKDLLGEQGVFRRLATLQGLVTDAAVDVATDTGTGTYADRGTYA